jgi:hypothetical protein
MKCVSREKSWGKFHKIIGTIHETCGTTLPVFVPANVIKFLGLKIFASMLDRKWPLATIGIETTISIDGKESDVLTYIGGCIAKKLHNKYGNGDKQEYIDFLTCNADSPCAASSNMTKTLDRGGLTYIKQTTLILFKKMEFHFKRVTNDHKKNVSKDDFVETCCQSIEREFMSLLCESGNPIDDDLAYSVLRDVVSKFFRIRIHHRCKILMEKHKLGSQKGLRKTLKKAKLTKSN